MIDFTNTEIAFRAKNNSELRSTKFLFDIMKSSKLVGLGKCLTKIAMAIHFPIGWAVKPTIYRHFVGGETLEKCAARISELQKYNVESILDYSAEGAEGDFYINRTFNETMRSIEFAGTNRSIAYAVFKPTAITRVKVLDKVSNNEELTDEDKKEFEAFCDRMEKLAAKAYECDVRLLVDAEHYSSQQAIDDVTNALMPKYNQKRAIVFNTLQMYRHDRYQHLIEEHKKAVEGGYIYGVKFVRGAYMDAERARAKEMGYQDPICVDKQATDDNYDAGMLYCIDNIDTIEMFSGTHNELSNIKLAEAIDAKGIARDDSRIYFSQLFGMSDNISYALAAEGYRVTKYIPYGPMKEVLPYLFRRAEENTMVEGQTLRELTLIETEWKRRKAARKNRNS